MNEGEPKINNIERLRRNFDEQAALMAGLGHLINEHESKEELVALHIIEDSIAQNDKDLSSGKISIDVALGNQSVLFDELRKLAVQIGLSAEDIASEKLLAAYVEIVKSNENL